MSRDKVLMLYRLPGAKRGDMSARGQRPEVRVAELQFSPTGRDFAATTTEGLLIYSLDSKLVFDPFELNVDITPTTIRAAVKREDYGAALVMSLRLNETDLVREVVEQVRNLIIILCFKSFGAISG